MWCLHASACIYPQGSHSACTTLLCFVFKYDRFWAKEQLKYSTVFDCISTSVSYFIPNTVQIKGKTRQFNSTMWFFFELKKLTYCQGETLFTNPPALKL